MRAFRAGVPLIVLLGLTAALIVITAISREVSARAGFLVERSAVLLVWLVALLLAAALIAWVTRSTFRRADSSAGLWLLALTAVALASPLLMVLLQHPAP